ncbi:hypothetical protein CRYUN_Cryun02cG0014100 [Craigia yunnanensis]
MLKELEKLGPKKGVITQSVKDVVQSLVDDDLVSKDKIGTSVYFWSLPSCAGNQDEREEALAELKAIELKYNELKEEMGQYADNDPAAINAMSLVIVFFQTPVFYEILHQKAIDVSHGAANRWTVQVGITDDFDYVELSPAIPLRAVGDQMLEGNPK